MAKTTTKPLEGQLFAPEAIPDSKGAQAKLKGGRRAAAPASPPAQRAVAVRTSRQGVAAATNATASDAFLAMVREVALAPNLDTDKLNALLGMQERVMDRQARQAFDDAFARMSPHLPTIDRKGKIEVRAKDQRTGDRTGNVTQSTPYPKWEDVREAVVPVLTRYGFAIRFKTGKTPEGLVKVIGILSGHGWREESDVDLQHDSSGSKNNVQAVASSVSYGKRIVAGALLNFVSRGEDDDGNAAGRPRVVGEPFTADEVEAIVAAAIAAELPGERLLKHMNEKRPKGHPEAQDIADLPQSRYDETVAAVGAWEQARKERQSGQKKP